MEIKLFGATWCPACRQAKEFLDVNAIIYDYIDVDLESENAQEIGVRFIPHLIAGEETVIGYNYEKYKKIFNT